MLDNSQFRKKKKKSDLFIWICAVAMFIIVVMGILALSFVGYWIPCSYVYNVAQANSGNTNDILYQRCYVNNNYRISQPKIICSNYTIKDNYYYCNIDDVKVIKDG